MHNIFLETRLSYQKNATRNSNTTLNSRRSVMHKSATRRAMDIEAVRPRDSIPYKFKKPEVDAM